MQPSHAALVPPGLPPTELPPPALIWGLPFVAILLAIALGPILAPEFWHRRMGAVAGACSLALLLPIAVLQGGAVAAATVWHALLVDYLPFLALLLALFATAGGILLRGGPWGTPVGNTALLAIGIGLAGVMGTTGAAMVLIRPLLRANVHRARRVHLVVFFIILVANAGGALSPLGDPPLYLGFLHGVPFTWPLRHLTPMLAMLAAPLLGVFYLLDRHLAAGDKPAHPRQRLELRGWVNVALIAMVVGVVAVQGVWHPGPVVLLGQKIAAERLAGAMALLGITGVSVLVTPDAVHQGNLFSWAPMAEVAKLFAALFVTIAPVLAMLAAGLDGPLAPLLRLTLDPHGQPLPLAYFWLTGSLSAFLDNAPTYLVFFDLAGGDPVRLTDGAGTILRAIAAGAVFFGGLTYVGNAPNMMLRTMAVRRGVPMPGFFGYLAWASLLLLPMLAVLTLLFLI